MRLAAGALVLAACSSATREGSPGPRPADDDDRPGAVAEAPPPGERGREIRYSAVPQSRFRIERFDTVLVQLPDSTTQSQIFTRTAWLTASTEDADSGFRATFVLDSLEVRGPMQASAAAALDSARGTRWTARVAPNGVLTAVTADRRSEVGDQLGALLQLLFPILPGESIRAGASWSDTTDVPTRVDLFEVREHATTQHLAMSPVVRGGGTVLPIQADASFRQTGTMTRMGQGLEMEATGNRRFTHYLRLDGLPAGLEGTEKSDVTVLVSAVGQSIRAQRSAGVRVTPLPAR